MPEEAFRDMWATVRSGSPWSALIKNRRKNGDHYWVLANVTPLVQNGRPVGYMSVRTRPTREQVNRAEALYACMRAEKASGQVRTTLRRGLVQHRSLQGTARRLLSMSFRKVVYGGVLGLTLINVGLATLAAGASLASGAFTAAAAVSAALGLGLAAGISRYGYGPLRQLASAANAIAAGGLRHRADVERDDEVGDIQRAVNQLNVNLQAVVGDIRRGVEGITVASGQISTGNTDLSARTESQATSLQQTASAVEQISATVAQSAATTREVNGISSSATEQTSRTGGIMDTLVASMGEITASSGKITRIIEVIDSIAFQTNILSLNATVEAARAGDDGRGFAAVAGEVRALAQRTLDASSQIKAIIEQSRVKIDNGGQLATAAGESLNETLGAVRSLNELIGQIGTSADENAGGVRQINDAVTQLDRLTQQNAAMVEELAAAAESLKQQAKAVSASVRVFQLAS